MNREDIIKLAREAGIEAEKDTLCRYKGWVEPLTRFAELVRADAIAEEREACAKVCYELPWKDMDHIPSNLAFAAAIRARSNT